jgi:OOP family OmpA-OmpF porin
MKRKAMLWSLAVAVVLSIGGWVRAANVITVEQTKQNVTTREVAVKTADNIVFLVDSSSSMATPYRKLHKTKYEMAKETLVAENAHIPALDYNAGLYTFIPWKGEYPMQRYDRARFGDAINQLPAQPSGRTPLVEGLNRLEGVLRDARGKTIVYIFSDGGYDPQRNGFKDPSDRMAELARKYDVCFMIFDYSETPENMKQVRDMAKANSCSQIIPFNAYMTDPLYALAPLFTLKTEQTVASRSERMVKGLNVDNIHFDFNRSAITSAAAEELDQVGRFLQSQPAATATLSGFTDSIGSEQYNMGLSQRRSEAAADYLESHFKIDSSRLDTQWFGKEDPVAGNDTQEGRAMNRRVQITISGL